MRSAAAGARPRGLMGHRRIGGHNEAVLREVLGLSQEEIVDLFLGDVI